MSNNREFLNQIALHIETCQTSLERLKDTCCMSARSVRMTALEETVSQLGEFDEGPDAVSLEYLDEARRLIERIGAALGELYATCCTPKREKLYVEMFKALGQIHLSIWKYQRAHQ